MCIKKYRDILFFVIIFITGYLSVFPVYVFCDEDKQIAIVVSKKIRPYMDVVEGITEGLEKRIKLSEVFFLSDVFDDVDRFKSVTYDLVVAIGPEATQWVGTDLNLPLKTKKIFTAVLIGGDRFKSGPESVFCGISLRIPVDKQISEIAKKIINLKRIGLLFDARNNNWFYEQASLTSQQYGITIIPLKVESKKHITQVLNENWNKIDCVWMIPDQTVISEKIIQYIIKLGVYNNKGVIGYNAFFIRSGAFFSFDFNYKVLGIQTAKKIDAYLRARVCKEEPPEFETIINHKMIDKLGLRVKE